MELSIHRADCLEINLRAIELATVRLLEGKGCRWCAARALLCEFTDYARLRHPPPEITDAITDRIATVLSTEPASTTTCRACRRARREARSACPMHALCDEHQ